MLAEAATGERDGSIRSESGTRASKQLQGEPESEAEPLSRFLDQRAQEHDQRIAMATTPARDTHPTSVDGHR